MARIVPELLTKYQARALNPVIIEFDSLQHKLDLFQTIAEMASSVNLTSFSGPIDLVSLRPRVRGLSTLSGIRADRAHFFDRIASRFQNTLISMKLFNFLNMIAAPLPSDSIDEIAQWPEATTIYEDKIQFIYQILPPEYVFKTRTGKPYTTTYYSKKLIGADIANQEGFTGKGITVAAPDTGGAPTHEMNFGMKFHSTMKEKGQFKDTNGHGEWVVSCIGGKHIDERSMNVPVEGMAPECTLIGIKCLGFLIGMGFQSDVMQAMEYAIDQQADIVSMSLGSDSMPAQPDDDPQIKLVDQMVAQGIIPVIAAGNAGPNPSTIGTPGCAANALTVGAWDPIRGGIANFSSRGPTLWGDTKPDVIAPGVDIYSGCVGLLDTQGDKIQNRYAILSGTSMACPHVAGLLACVKEYYKSLGQQLTVSVVKSICQTYGTPKNNDSGWGFMRWDWFKTYATEQGWI